MCPDDATTTNKEESFLKRRIRIKTTLNIFCIVILIAIVTAVIVFITKYHEVIEKYQIEEIRLEPDEYPPSIREVLRNNSLSVTGKNNLQNLIVPGTKWCGKGSIAVSYDDLGVAREVDICCRAHDLCPDSIEPGETRHGLENTGFGVWSLCDCDEKLRMCLKNVNNLISDGVGFLFFNVLGPKCFKKEYPVVGCHKCEYTTYAYKERDRKRCVEPVLDKSGSKIYQCFDNHLYY
ncbi:phospholipase A2-like [Zophobas morio]|uniref:phospholipase A2-like n=1 Tax=Zophobas morio TaxID=2755281 RepID=UPI0030828971